MRRALALLTLILLALPPSAEVALAQPAPTAAGARVTTQPLPENCVGNSIGRPECGVKPQNSGDRGGAAQLALFGLVLVGMGAIFSVVVRSTRARDRTVT